VIRSYLPALVFVGLGTALGLAFAVLNTVIGPRKRYRIEAQVDPYECGLPSEVKKNFRFGISFYLIAMLFILFDIEVIFLYPVAIQLDAFGTFALLETIVFIVLLFIAFVYVWRRGALEWR
jgi:NADH-quinone oxidoreductase subunit A